MALTFTSAAQIRVKAAPGSGLGVEDVELLHQSYLAKGIPIRLPPTTFPWALEMQIEDPDGNVLRIGSDPK